MKSFATLALAVLAGVSAVDLSLWANKDCSGTGWVKNGATRKTCYYADDESIHFGAVLGGGAHPKDSHFRTYSFNKGSFCGLRRVTSNIPDKGYRCIDKSVWVDGYSGMDWIPYETLKVRRDDATESPAYWAWSDGKTRWGVSTKKEGLLRTALALPKTGPLHRNVTEAERENFYKTHADIVQPQFG